MFSLIPNPNPNPNPFETPVIWDAVALIVTSLWCFVLLDEFVRPSYKNSEYDASYHRLSIMFDLKLKYRVYASTNCVIALYRTMTL